MEERVNFFLVQTRPVCPGIGPLNMLLYLLILDGFSVTVKSAAFEMHTSEIKVVKCKICQMWC